MAAGVVMLRASNSWPIAMRRRIDASRSSCRMRRSSADIFGFASGDGIGGWSGDRLMSCQLVAVATVITPTAPVLSSPPNGADGDGTNEDVDETAKGEADTETEGEP